MKETYDHEFNKWQRLFAKLTTMWRINHDSIDFKWGYFAPRFGFELMLHRGGYFDSHYKISFCIIWGMFSISLPFKTSLGEGCSLPKFGIEIHNNTFWLHYGGKYDESFGQVTGKSWITWDLPFFSLVYNGHWIQSGGRFVKVPEYKPGEIRINPIPDTELHFLSYRRSPDQVQTRIATCHVSCRQWHRKWFPFAKLTVHNLEVELDRELGPGTGSWKGGTTGFGIEIKPNETMLQALRRAEKSKSF